MPQTPEQKASWAAKRRAERIAKAVELFSHKMPKEEVRELSRGETAAGIVRWIEALKQHWSWIGQSVGDVSREVRTMEQRIDGHQAIMEQLVDQATATRELVRELGDLVAQVRQEREQDAARLMNLETRLSWIGRSLADVGPLTNMEEVLEAIEFSESRVDSES